MDSISLSVPRGDFVHVLNVLGAVRRKRFRSVLPVWLHFDQWDGQLWIEEQRAAAAGAVAARGMWPPMGATVDLYLLRRAATMVSAERVQLVATADAILVPTERGHVSLKLLSFGPESPGARTGAPSHPLEDLPLFRWARERRQLGALSEASSLQEAGCPPRAKGSFLSDSIRYPISLRLAGASFQAKPPEVRSRT